MKAGWPSFPLALEHLPGGLLARPVRTSIRRLPPDIWSPHRGLDSAWQPHRTLLVWDELGNRRIRETPVEAKMLPNRRQERERTTARRRALPELGHVRFSANGGCGRLELVRDLETVGDSRDRVFAEYVMCVGARGSVRLGLEPVTFLGGFLEHSDVSFQPA